MHLIFLIHGLFGNPDNMKSMADSLNHALDGDDVIIHRANCMSAIGTFDGIVLNAERLKGELLEQLRKTNADCLSIIGYSMGGLCGRYLVGILEDLGVFKRVQPKIFATFATPHLGTNFPERSAFSRVFDLVGSRIVGLSGRDLFCKNDLLTELADPRLRYYRGLQRFPNLLLFANAVSDRTVPFWTAYITPVDPFRHRAHVNLVTHSNNYFVNISQSTWHESKVYYPQHSWKQKLSKGLLFGIFFPMALCILIIVMSAVTVIACVNRHWIMSKKRSSVGDELMGELSEAVDETLELTSSQETVTIRSPVPNKSCISFGSLSPGLSGVIKSCPIKLDLSPQTQINLANLNQLPWVKFAVVLPSLNSHAVIVDRRQKSPAGKSVLNAFSEVIASL